MDEETLKLLIAEGEGLTVEFKEKYSPKIDRDMVAFANARGGIILLGVADNARITGAALSNQLKTEILSLARNCDPHVPVSRISAACGVVALEIPEGTQKPYSCSSGYFRRLDAVTQKMSQQEVRAIFRETTDLLFESLPCQGLEPRDISLSKVKDFLKAADASFRPGRDNLEKILASLGVWRDSKAVNAGALMFAAAPARFIPHCEAILCAFKGADKLHLYDRKDVRGTLPEQLAEAMAFIKKHINIRSEIREMDRRDIYELPLPALREALVNAVVHRDYSLRGTSLYVNIFDDRVEIENPGGIPAGLPPKDFGRASVRRNLLLADLFHRVGKVERIGSGIGKMRSLMAEAGLRKPVFEISNFFRAVFYRDPARSLKEVKAQPNEALASERLGEKLGERLGERLGEKLGETAHKILHHLGENPHASAKELAAWLGISMTAIEKNLFRLKGKGWLRHVGPARGGHWEVL